MTRAKATQALADFAALYRAHTAAAWHPRETPPPAVVAWIAAAPLLLRLLEQLVHEGLADDENP